MVRQARGLPRFLPRLGEDGKEDGGKDRNDGNHYE
jgi:hypothetical protein